MSHSVCSLLCFLIGSFAIVRIVSCCRIFLILRVTTWEVYDVSHDIAIIPYSKVLYTDLSRLRLIILIMCDSSAMIAKATQKLITSSNIMICALHVQSCLEYNLFRIVFQIDTLRLEHSLLQQLRVEDQMELEL